LSEIIQELALTPVEEKVYLVLLSSGQLSVAEIAEVIDEKPDDVEQSITSLINKDLVFTNPSIVKKFTAVYPMVKLSEKAKRSTDVIQGIGNEISQYTVEKADVLDQIVKKQKESIQKITADSKTEIRIATEKSTEEITSELDKLIAEISQILNTESTQISQQSLTTTTDLSKHYQENSEAASNSIGKGVSDIANSLEESNNIITKSFSDATRKVQAGSAVMENSLHASLDNSFAEYDRILIDIQQKIDKALGSYDSAARDNMSLQNQGIKDSFGKIIDTVDSKLGLYDEETNHILEERIRSITASMMEMNDEFAKVIKDRLTSINREYQQMMESFTRNVQSMFTDANAQIEQLINAKAKTNEEKLDNLFKILRDNLQRNANDTKAEVRSREVRVTNELKTILETTNRKMEEAQDKANMELAGNFNKAKTDFDTTKTNMVGVVSRAREDFDSKFEEARDATTSSIVAEFKANEAKFAEIGAQIVEDIKALNNTSEAKGKTFVKETEERAKSAIAKIEMPAKTLLNRGKQTALRYVQDQANLVAKTIDQSRSGIEDSIISETTNVKNQFKGYGEKFKESNKVIERLLGNIELSYRELITRIKDMSRPSANTTTIIGKDSVLNQMKEILSRVKSTVTLVYPQIQDIHTDLLLNSNPRTRIIVISDFDPFKNADVIKSLMVKENIQLKSLDVNVTRPYYAIGRDAEEGLIGTIDDSKQVVAITSNSQAFVELINTEVINGIITPKTKRVTLPDNG
jgi:sugar-specific transcriptional regulator TrmB